MSISEPTSQRHYRQFECFGRHVVTQQRPTGHRWVAMLETDLKWRGLSLHDSQSEALARFVPLLICGEQSAVHVFRSAADNHSNAAAEKLKSAFFEIERDEAGHEIAWQSLYAQLPEPTDLRSLKRRAALFFARLGRANSIAEHFAQVSQLDSAVGAMMWHLERSDVATDDRLRFLTKKIKTDEAKHVSISRKYARELGINRTTYAELGNRVRSQLVELLIPIGDALETIGIDVDRMLAQIAKASARQTQAVLAK